jgi:hypothetical protein
MSINDAIAGVGAWAVYSSIEIGERGLIDVRFVPLRERRSDFAPKSEKGH